MYSPIRRLVGGNARPTAVPIDHAVMVGRTKRLATIRLMNNRTETITHVDELNIRLD